MNTISSIETKMSENIKTQIKEVREREIGDGTEDVDVEDRAPKIKN